MEQKVCPVLLSGVIGNSAAVSVTIKDFWDRYGGACLCKRELCARAVVCLGDSKDEIDSK